MKKTFQTDLFGELTEEEVFIYYDEPLFLSCRDKDGVLYLLNCVRILPDGNEWVLVSITEKRFKRAMNKEIDTRWLFEKPEYFLWFFKETQEGDAELVRTKPKDEYLADAGYFL